MNSDSTVWVVITRDDDRHIRDVEILDSPPQWDLPGLGQVCYTGNVNGGDSVRYHQPVPDEVTRDHMVVALRTPGGSPRALRERLSARRYLLTHGWTVDAVNAAAAPPGEDT